MRLLKGKITNKYHIKIINITLFSNFQNSITPKTKHTSTYNFSFFKNTDGLLVSLLLFVYDICFFKCYYITFACQLYKATIYVVQVRKVHIFSRVVKL